MRNAKCSALNHRIPGRKSQLRCCISQHRSRAAAPCRATVTIWGRSWVLAWIVPVWGISCRIRPMPAGCHAAWRYGRVLPPGASADARSVYAFALEDKADFIASNLTEAGRSPVHVERCDAVPEEVLRGPERQTQDATVPSLRADTVLAAMMRTSRSIAAQAIQSGRVEVNHVPLRTAHEDVFEGDIFTVRGVGRYRLVAIGGKSRKDRIFITFY